MSVPPCKNAAGTSSWPGNANYETLEIFSLDLKNPFVAWTLIVEVFCMARNDGIHVEAW